MRLAGRVFLLIVLTVVGAGAHPILQNPLWIEASAERVRLHLDVSVRELIVVQGLPVAQDGTPDAAVAEEFAGKHAGYVIDHFAVKADGEPLRGKLVSITSQGEFKDGPEGPDQSHFRYVIDFPLTVGAKPPAVLSFRQTMCVEFPSAPGVPWDLSYAYRYGAAPGQSPLKFGPLQREQELSFNTGCVVGTPVAGAPVAGSMVVDPMPKSWAALWLLFIGAVFLGATQRRLWYQLAAVLWLGGFLAAQSAGAAIPEWPVALFCGAVTILAAADNIHGHAVAESRPRRRVLLLVGCVLYGAGLSQAMPVGSAENRSWPVLMAVGAVVVAILILWLGHLARQHGRTAGRLFTQLTSLAICGGAIVLMLRVLHAWP